MTREQRKIYTQALHLTLKAQEHREMNRLPKDLFLSVTMIDILQEKETQKAKTLSTLEKRILKNFYSELSLKKKYENDLRNEDSFFLSATEAMAGAEELTPEYERTYNFEWNTNPNSHYEIEGEVKKIFY